MYIGALVVHVIDDIGCLLSIHLVCVVASIGEQLLWDSVGVCLAEESMWVDVLCYCSLLAELGTLLTLIRNPEHAVEATDRKSVV